MFYSIIYIVSGILMYYYKTCISKHIFTLYTQFNYYYYLLF